MKLHFIAVLLLAVVVVSARYESEWEGFKAAYRKTYSSDDEEALRQAIFANNFDEVKQHNYEYSLGLTTFTMAINHLSDLTFEEVEEQYMGVNYADNNVTYEESNAVVDAEDLPASVDWRKEGVVTPVKNQGRCGSCWAFSVTGAIEGIMAIVNGPLVSLSEQNLIDCSHSYGCYGCNGCWPEHAFQYVIANKGIDTERSYPYQGVNHNCRYDAENRGAEISSYTMLPTNNEMTLTAAIVKQPVSITIQATRKFMQYHKGIFFDATCNNRLNHAVLAVGYDEDPLGKYYIVKNQWGTTWGLSGYVWMARGRMNNCGVATHAIVPLV